MIRACQLVPALTLVLALSLPAMAQTQPAPRPQPGPLQLAPPGAQIPPLPAPRPSTTAPAPVQIRPTHLNLSVEPLTAAQLATLQKISEVYNATKEMSGIFTQVGQDGSRVTGRFYISKPGKVRFRYDKPSPLDIISNGVDVVVRDRVLNTQDLYPLTQTPLRYLLNDRIDLTKDAKVVGVVKEQDMISITIEEKGNFNEGHLTLFFDANNLDLKQWTIADARGNETAVAVQNVVNNQRNPAELFVIEARLPGQR